MPAQASDPLGRGQGFIRDLGRAVFGPPAEEISAARAARTARENQELLRRQQELTRDNTIANAGAEVEAIRILQPAQLSQAEAAQGLRLRGARADADIQRSLEAGRTGDIQNTMQTAGRVKADLNQAGFDHVRQLAQMGIDGETGARRDFFGGDPANPFSRQLFEYVASESAKDRAHELELERRNTAPLRLLRDGVLMAGLFLS